MSFNYDNALKYLNRYLETNGFYDLLLFYTDIVYSCNENYKDSKELFDKYHEKAYQNFYEIREHFDEKDIDNIYAILLCDTPEPPPWIKNNMNKVIDLYEKNIDNKHVLNNLGLMYYEGKYLEKNLEKAKEYLEKSNTISSKVNLSRILIENGDLDEAMDLLIYCANKNCKVALNILGSIHSRNALNEKDEEIKIKLSNEAIKYYSKSIELGNDDALFGLAEFYFYDNKLLRSKEYLERYIDSDTFNTKSDKSKLVYYQMMTSITRVILPKDHVIYMVKKFLVEKKIGNDPHLKFRIRSFINEYMDDIYNILEYTTWLVENNIVIIKENEIYEYAPADEYDDIKKYFRGY